MSRRLAGVVFATLMLVIGGGAFASMLPQRPPRHSPPRPPAHAGPLRGGSNYLWYTLGAGCEREQ